MHEVTQAGSAAFNYVYDANGNVKTRQGANITWSSYNYPTFFSTGASGEAIGLLYDNNRRVYQLNENGPSGLQQTVRVDEGLFDFVKTSTTQDYRHYIYAEGKPVAIASRNSAGVNTIFYLLSDQQGSVAAITDSSGAVVVGESFDAYGGRRNPTTWSGAPSSTDLATIAGITRHGYTFQDALGSLTGLNYMVGRVQDAVIGRWLSPDPSIPNAENPQSYNRYSYVRNNPLTYVDPTGFEEMVPSPVPEVDVNGTYEGPGTTPAAGGVGGEVEPTYSAADANDLRAADRAAAHAAAQAAKGVGNPTGPANPANPAPSQPAQQPSDPPQQTTQPQPTSPQATSPQPTSPSQPTDSPAQSSGFGVITAGHAIEATATIVIGVAFAPAEVPLGVAFAAVTGAYLTGELIGEVINIARGE